MRRGRYSLHGSLNITSFRVNEQRPILWSRSGAFLYVEFAEGYFHNSKWYDTKGLTWRSLNRV